MERSRALKQPRIYEGGWLVRTHASTAGGRCQARDPSLLGSCPDLLCNPAFAINAPIARKPCTHAPSIKVSPCDNPFEPSVTTAFFLVLPESWCNLQGCVRRLSRIFENIGCFARDRFIGNYWTWFFSFFFDDRLRGR